MERESDSPASDTNWPDNYFNYFTEIEEHFQRARGTSLFLLSPLDWALIETWKNAEIPLEAVLQAIEIVFEKWRTGKSKRRAVNSLAYCTQAVMEAAERTRGHTARKFSSEPPFTDAELQAYLQAGSAQLRQRTEQVFHEIASSVDTLALNLTQYRSDVEDLESRLMALEDKMVAAARVLQSDGTLHSIRKSLERELRPYRGKMTADQLAMLERRYIDTALLEQSSLPRLSLFYLR